MWKRTSGWAKYSTNVIPTRDELVRKAEEFAPPGISAEGVGDINDAYRHYMSSAYLSIQTTPTIALLLGYLNELKNLGHEQEHNTMDMINNVMGVWDSADYSEFGVEQALDFIVAVTNGSVVVLDENGKFRPAELSDLPGVRKGAPIEDRYIPERSRHDDNDVMTPDDVMHA